MSTPPPSPPKNSVVALVVDRLHAGFLGAYGNTWIQTPSFDRLAAESFLFDRAMIDSPRLESLYRSYWEGRHALAPRFSAPVGQAGETASGLPESLPEKLAAAGYEMALLTDEPSLAELPGAAAFGRIEIFEPPADLRVAAEAEETHLAQFFAVAADWLAGRTEPFCLWLHVGSLGRIWDAPLELRDQYAAEDDPRSLADAAVPCRRLPRDFDPDELLAIVHAYAGQVSLLDLCLGPLLDALVDSPAGPRTLFTLLAARGFPLGEHARLGPCDEALFGELTQIPWLLRLPDGRGASDRTQSLVQPADLCATLLDWCGLALPADGIAAMSPAAAGQSLLPLASGDVQSIRDRAVAIALPHERAIVTPAWSMRLTDIVEPNAPADDHEVQQADGRMSRVELFAKPDDRFEVNEASNRCRDVVLELRTALEQFEQACQSAEPAPLPPLPESLLVGTD